MKLVLGQPVVTLALARGETLSLDDARGLRIVGRSGLVWVTQERSPADHLMGPGAQLTVTRAGRTVVEALAPGLVEIGRTPRTRGRRPPSSSR
jgi:DUF2917 family protein